MNTQLSRRAAILVRIDALCSNGKEGHVAGDAHFVKKGTGPIDNGKRYRFVSRDGKLGSLYASREGEGVRGWAREWHGSTIPVSIRGQIETALTPDIVNRTVAGAVARMNAEDDERARDEQESLRTKRMHEAIPQLLASLKQALRYIEVQTAYTGAMTAAEVEAQIIKNRNIGEVRIGTNSCTILGEFNIGKARDTIAKLEGKQ